MGAFQGPLMKKNINKLVLSCLSKDAVAKYDWCIKMVVAFLLFIHKGGDFVHKGGGLL